MTRFSILTMLLSLLALISGVLCVSNLFLITRRGTNTPDQLLSYLCALANLILIVFTKQYISTDTNDSVPIVDVILRKQLQIIQWHSLFTKAATLHRIQSVLYYKENHKYKKIRRCQSDEYPFRSKNALKLQSWVRYPSLPDLKILNCASTDTS